MRLLFNRFACEPVWSIKVIHLMLWVSQGKSPTISGLSGWNLLGKCHNYRNRIKIKIRATYIISTDATCQRFAIGYLLVATGHWWDLLVIYILYIF